MISAGAMNRRVRIEKLVTSRSPESNAVVKTWQLVSEVWAHRRDESAGEYFGADARNTEQLAVFTIWFRPGVTPEFRLIDRGQEFNVTGVLELGQRVQLQLKAKAVNSNPTT